MRNYPIYAIVVARMQQDPIVPVSPAPANQPGPTVGGGTSRRSSGILSTIAILIAAPLVALLLTSFVFQSYEVDGPSMETTLQHQDRLIVWKLPRTLARITKHSYLPARGNIVIFVKRGLNEFGTGGDKQLVKRVIGLPGDRVVVNRGKITIYNAEHPDGYNPDVGQNFSDGIDDFTNGQVDLVVAENEIFVCGDNRPNSLDSRSFGTVPTSDLVGRLAFRIFPVNKFKSFI